MTILPCKDCMVNPYLKHELDGLTGNDVWMFGCIGCGAMSISDSIEQARRLWNVENDGLCQEFKRRNRAAMRMREKPMTESWETDSLGEMFRDHISDHAVFVTTYCTEIVHSVNSKMDKKSYITQVDYLNTLSSDRFSYNGSDHGAKQVHDLCVDRVKQGLRVQTIRIDADKLFS